MKNNFCEICYEPINKIKRVCGMCADNRVEDGIWKEEEKEEKMYNKEKKWIMKLLFYVFFCLCF